jgi:uncharacterized FlaG/YvyC family protein
VNTAGKLTTPTSKQHSRSHQRRHESFSRESSQSDDEDEDANDKVPLSPEMDEVSGRIQAQVDNQQSEISDAIDDDLESVGQAEAGADETEEPESAKRRASEELSGE